MTLPLSSTVVIALAPISCKRQYTVTEKIAKAMPSDSASTRPIGA